MSITPHNHREDTHYKEQLKIIIVIKNKFRKHSNHDNLFKN